MNQETILQVLEHASYSEWKLIIALARFGGFRAPSTTSPAKDAEHGAADALQNSVESGCEGCKVLNRRLT